MVAPTIRINFDTLSEGNPAGGLFQAAGGSIGGTGANLVAASAAAIGSGRGASASGGTTASAFGILNFTSGLTQFGMQYVITIGTAPAVAADSMTARNNAATPTNIFNVRVSATNVLTVADSGGTTRLTSTTALPAGKYIVTVAAQIGTTTTNGRLLAWLDRADGTQVVAPVDVTTANTGTTEPTFARYGKISSTNAATILFDKPALVENSLAKIDLPAASADPIADIGGDQTVEPGESFVLDGSGSVDPDGTITGYSFSAPNPVVLTGTGATRTGVAPKSLTDQTYTITLTVTDDSGRTDSDTMVLTVPKTTKAYVDANGVWQPLLDYYL